MKLINIIRKYRKVIKYTYFILLTGAIYLAYWRYQTIADSLISSTQISISDHNQLGFRREIFKWLSALGLITIFVNLSWNARRNRDKESQL
jgi:hypothetical protein